MYGKALTLRIHVLPYMWFQHKSEAMSLLVLEPQCSFVSA